VAPTAIIITGLLREISSGGAKCSDSAINCYQTYLRKFPDDEQVLLNLANTYAEAGNSNAIDLANKIQSRYPYP
jgi:hypothetical protein